jgi:mono/diheme cytochrome c family protein
MRKPIAICIFASVIFTGAQVAEPQPGLVLTWQVGEVKSSTVVPNLWLYVPAGKPPSPFVPPGRFTATFEGFVNIDLRGDYSFHATGKGGVKLEVNNAVLLDLKGMGGVAKTITKTVRLNKGANAIKVTYSSPSKGDAQLRIFWSEYPDKPLPHEPIRSGQLTHLPGAPLAQASLVETGREIFIEHRCQRCHVSEGKGIPELAMSGPSFAAIGDRRHRDWMAQWVLNPKAQRKSSRMPQLLHGKTAPADAAAIAAFLASLKGPPKPSVEYLKPDLEAGEELAGQLNCVGCHTLPGAAAVAGKLSLSHVNRKFPEGELVDFLRAPNRHYAWTRMPKFALTAKEAWDISQWLRVKAPAHAEPKIDEDIAALALGKKLLTTLGCINCHNHEGENKFTAPNLSALTPEKWKGGCLAEEPAGKSPHFGFAPAQRAALRAFAATDRQSLQRHEPAEFARRQIRVLNCNACHGELDGFAKLDPIGLKLRPEWMQLLLAGDIKPRPRPWLPHRMPAFPARAKPLAQGLAQAHGYAPRTMPEPAAVNAELAEVGRQLVGVDGGFSCIACHGVKNREPLQVFEAQGINFAQVGARLQPEFYLRWMLDPLRVDPQTRMPTYFDKDARSVLVDVLEGDAKKQIEAIRQYLRQGNKMKIPVMQ